MDDPPAQTQPKPSLGTRLAHLVEIAVLLAVVAALAGLLGRWHFAFDLASHFRVQCTVALLLAAPLLWILHSRRWAAVSLLAGLGLAASLLPYFPPAEDATAGDYRLMTMNVHTSNPRHDLAIAAIRATDPDIIVLQETDARWLASLDAALAAGWPYRETVPRSDNFGIAIYSKIAWTSCEVVEHTDQLPAPAIDARFELPNGRQLRLFGVHPLPPMNDGLWSSRNSLFAGLAREVRRAGPERTIVAGDLNCTPWSYWFGRFLQDAQLRDSARGRFPRGTWSPVPNVPLAGLPIDHVLVGADIGVSHRGIGPAIGSDHRPVIIDFQ